MNKSIIRSSRVVGLFKSPRNLNKILISLSPKNVKATMVTRIRWSKCTKCTVCDKSQYPIYYMLLILGLNQTINKQSNSYFFKLYNWIVFIILITTTIRKIYQTGMKEDGSRESIEEFFLNPRSLVTLCNALLMLSGILASSLLYNLGGQRLHPLKVLFETGHQKRTKESIQKSFIINTFLSVLTTILALIMAATYALVKKGYLVNLMGKPSYHSDSIICIIVDSYALFVSRCAISAASILFYQHCSVIRRSIKMLIKEMVPEEQNECPLRESSLQKIHECQQLFQMISNGKAVVEEYYSFALFYAYGICIPLFCSLLFVVMNSESIGWSESFSILIWLINAFIVLLLFSLPAFKIHEDSDLLLTSSFRMYHETFHEDRDPTVLAQMTFFVSQISATKLTLSACNYFYMNRSILLHLVSSIMTYFLLLWEFEEKHREHALHNKTIT